MYDPKIARFLQEDTYLGDPNDPLSLNLYTYCENEPIMYWDPTGHMSEIYGGYQRESKYNYRPGSKFYDKMRAERPGIPDTVIEQLRMAAIDEVSWEEYDGWSEQEQISFFNTYIYQPTGLDVFDKHSGYHKTGWESYLRNSTKDKIIRGIDSGLFSFAESNVNGAISLGEMVYNTYKDPVATWKQLKSDIKYAADNPGQVWDTTKEMAGDAVNNAVKDFKDNVIYGDAESRTKYLTRAGLEAATIAYGGSKLKAAWEQKATKKFIKKIQNSSNPAKAAEEVAHAVATNSVADKPFTTRVGKGTSELAAGNRYLNVEYSNVSRGIRNTEQLTAAQEAQVYKHIEELGLNSDDFLISSHVSCYSDMVDKAFLGPDMFRASARTTRSVLETMTPRAAIAHEAGHMITTRVGAAFEAGTLYDEVLASLTGRQLPGLSKMEKYQLLRDAAERAKIEGQRLRDIIPDLGRR